MTPSEVLALIEAIVSAIKTLREISPGEIVTIETVVWDWFNCKSDTPARLAPDFAPMLAEAKANFLGGSGERSSSPDAPTDRPPPPDSEPPTLVRKKP